MERPRWNRSWQMACAGACLGALLFVLSGCGGGALVSTSQPPVLKPVSITMSPSSATVPVTGTQTFKATVTNTSDIAVTWLVNGVPGGNLTWGTITPDGVYTAPQYAPPNCPPDCPVGTTMLSAGSVLVTAVADADNTASKNANVTISGNQEPLVITLSPQNGSIQTGNTLTFQAALSNSTEIIPDPTVTWEVNGIAGGNSSVGTIVSGPPTTDSTVVPVNTATYTPPLFVASTGLTVTIKAISNAQTYRSSSTTLKITNGPIGVIISPTSVGLLIGTKQQFTAGVTGTSNQAVTWEVNGVPGGSSDTGTISTTGLYTAPATVDNVEHVTVTAVSVADTSASASAQVTVAASTFAIDPNVLTVEAGDPNQNFTAVDLIPSDTVSWNVNGTVGGNSTVGTIVPGENNTAIYTPPAAVPNPATVTVTAVSNSNPSLTASAAVTIKTQTFITVMVMPPTATVVINQTQQFTAHLDNTNNQAVTWEVNDVVGGDSVHGTITTGGLYTAPASVPTPALVVVSAVSVADPLKKGSATVLIVATAPPVQVIVTPTMASVEVGFSAAPFTATVMNADDPTVTWEVNGIVGGNSTVGTIVDDGTFPATGTYTAPVVVPNPSVVTVSAVSNQDSTKSGSASVTITPEQGITVTISPPSANVMVGQSSEFVATVNGTDNTTVTWSLKWNGALCTEPLVCGSISTAGAAAEMYTAPLTVPNPPTVSLIATSNEDPTKSATAILTIEVNASIGITITPGMPITGAGGATINFNTLITNAPSNTNVTWTLGCISGDDNDSTADNCNDTDGDGDGPGCITTSDGVQHCGTNTQRQAGDLTLIYTPPLNVFTQVPKPNSCSNGVDTVGWVPLTGFITFGGQNATETVCIKVTP